MTKKEFLEEFDLILKVRWGIRKEAGKLVNDDIAKCDFTGVYAIFNENNLIYVGSGYTKDSHFVSDRLKQYLTKSKTGNTLMKKILESKMKTSEDDAIEMIKTFDFIAFEHIDLENYLISKTNCEWNDHGKKDKWFIKESKG